MLRMTLAAWILTAGALAAQTVEGRVINTATGSGIPDVAVGLVGSGQVDYRATTDATGHFRMDAVKDGSYTPFYNNPNFTPAGSPIRPIQVTAGSGPVELEYKMFPKVKISGRVLDASGKPVPNAVLMLTQTTGSGSLDMVYTFPGGANGEYRGPDGLQAGAWILSATAPSSFTPPEPRDGQRLGWAKTFYPGVADAALATPVTLSAGGELSHLDIKLVPVPVHRIHGVVLDDRGNPVPKASVLLGTRILESPPGPPQDTNPDDGTFEFASVVKGEYRLLTTVNRDGVRLWAAESAQMADRDLEKVVLRLAAPFSIQGKVIMEAPDGQAAPKPPAVGLEYTVISAGFFDSALFFSVPSAGGGFLNVTPDGKGDLTFKNIYPGEYTIIPGSAPPAYYLDSIRLGGADALGSNVQIFSGAAPITVTYKLNGGTVRGTVEDCAHGIVMLIPQDPAHRRDRFVRQTNCSENGRFEILAVRPGDYYAFAVAKDDPIVRSFELDQTMTNQSIRVTVRANEATLADCRFITR